MILSFIMYIFRGFISVMVGILPDSDGLPSGVSSALASFIAQARSFDWFIPVNTLLTVFALAFAFSAGIILFRSVRWVINVVRGSGA